jgi:inorganic pyrophosphatase
LEHYFRTYKEVPGTTSNVEIESRYGRDEACEVVAASIEDYNEEFLV